MEQIKRQVKLQKFKDDIYLIVEQSGDHPCLTSMECLSNELAMRKITCEADVLEKCFTEATGEKVKIAANEEEIIYASLLELSLSDDLMTAILKVYPSLDDSVLTMVDLQNFLQAKGIKYGIKSELFSEIIKRQPAYQEWIIATGKPAEHGKDASLKFFINTGGLALKPKELEDGRVDFYSLNLIQIVDQGTVLVEKTLATPGISGVNVLGGEVKANPGKDRRLPVGMNTQITENNTKLVSTKQGHVNYINNKINVHPTYEVKGDVDFNTGNIKFPGNVIIKGSVKNSFLVEAGGDVEIFGNLEGTVLAGGNLKVNKGIVRGKAEVKGSVFARYIENSNILSNEEIIVTEAVMHSIVKAGRKLVVSGKKGLIVGGKISVGEEISAKNIGAPMGTATLLEVGILPELRDEYKALCSKLKKDRKDYEKNQKIFNTLQEIKKRAGELSRDKQELFMKICRRQYQCQKEIEEFQNRKLELEQLFHEMGNPRIRVMNMVYCGVVVTIGNATLNVNEEKERVEFRLDDYEVRGFNL